jgi:hypothetical protein
MTLDIVVRLREQGKDAFAKQYSLGMFKLCDEAATEIERLRIVTQEWVDEYVALRDRARPEQTTDAYRRAWDAYVEFSMESGNTTFDCIKATVDAALSHPVAWRSREKGALTWQAHASNPTEAISKYAIAGLDAYEIEPLYAVSLQHHSEVKP